MDAEMLAAPSCQDARDSGRDLLGLMTSLAHLVMISENPSTHWPQDPETPQIV
jgi:hypothetical protein